MGVSFTLDPITVAQIIAATVLPILVGLVTTRETHAGRKAVFLAVLALISSVLAEAIRAWESGAVYDIGVGVLGALPTFMVAVATHFGLWKPTGISGTMQDIGTGRHRKDGPAA